MSEQRLNIRFCDLAAAFAERNKRDAGQGAVRNARNDAGRLTRNRMFNLIRLNGTGNGD